MEKQQVELDHAFSAKFRKEIQAYGLKQIIRDLMSSNNKVEQKKLYLARECSKKNTFRAQFENACAELKIDRQLRPAVMLIQKEIIAW